MKKARVLPPGSGDYDGSIVGFLRVIWILWALVLAGPAWAAPQGDRSPEQEPAPFVVRVGSGEVAPATLTLVEALVATHLPALAVHFPDLSPRPFAVFVHEREGSMPDSLRTIRHPGAPGFALLGRHQIHLVLENVRRSDARLDGVVAHELVHELLDQHVAPHGREIPRWFHEGLAQHLAGDTYLGAREEDIVWRVDLGGLHSFSRIRGAFPIAEEQVRVAYAQSYSYVSWLVRHFGLELVVRVAADTTDDLSFEHVLVEQTGRTTLELEDAWKRYLVYGSGAWWRVLFGNCFSSLLVLALPVFFVAVIRRRRRARRLKAAMELREATHPHEFSGLPPGFLGPPAPPELFAGGDEPEASLDVAPPGGRALRWRRLGARRD